MSIIENDPEGDPRGRRLAKNRANLLAEALGVAHSLGVLLRRANFDETLCDELLKSIVRQEAIELQRAHGRIESRNRFKRGVPYSLLEGRPVSNLYVDESGRSNPGYIPGLGFFSLGAVALTEEEADTYCDRADEIKVRFFGNTQLTFHEPNMRNRAGEFYFGNNEHEQGAFDDAIAGLIEETDFVAFGVGIRKQAFAKEFAEAGLDPYLPSDVYVIAISMMLERYVDFLANSPEKRMGRLTFEGQGAKEDAYHQLEYARLLIEGTQWVSDKGFRQWLETGLRFTPKRGSHPTELADMLSRDLFEWTRDDCESSPKWWELFSRKMYCRGDGRMGKFGVKVFPDSDIREAIELHRRGCGADL